MGRLEKEEENFFKNGGGGSLPKEKTLQGRFFKARQQILRVLFSLRRKDKYWKSPNQKEKLTLKRGRGPSSWSPDQC